MSQEERTRLAGPWKSGKTQKASGRKRGRRRVDTPQKPFRPTPSFTLRQEGQKELSRRQKLAVDALCQRRTTLGYAQRFG